MWRESIGLLRVTLYSVYQGSAETSGLHKVLSEMGLWVVRFGNEKVLRDLSAVVGKIRGLVAQ